MARQRKHRPRARSRSGRFLGIYILLSAVLITIAIVAGCIVFFKVNQFQVDGAGKYSTEEIVAASGIQTGDNLCLIRRTEVANQLLTQLPYVQSVNIQRKLPDTVVITVTETAAAAAVQTDTGWWLVNSSGKILEAVQEPGACIQVTGLTLLSPSVGTQLAVDVDRRLELSALLKLMSAMEGRELLDQVTAVDLSTGSEINMVYQGRLTVKMKLDSDFDYNAKMLSAVLEQIVTPQWSETDSGTLDMTYEDGNPHLQKQAAEAGE